MSYTDAALEGNVVLADSPLEENLVSIQQFITEHSEDLQKGKFSLGERVRLYGLVNGSKKEIEKVQKAMNSEIKDQVESACKKDKKTGKLTAPEDDEILRQTAKGTIVIEDGGAKVELRPKNKENFDEDAARKVLGKLKLLESVLVENIVITDDEYLVDAMERAIKLAEKGETDKVAKLLSKTLRENVSKEEVLAQDKIEALVKLDKIKATDVAKMFQTEVTYSLYG